MFPLKRTVVVTSGNVNDPQKTAKSVSVDRYRLTPLVHTHTPLYKGRM